MIKYISLFSLLLCSAMHSIDIQVPNASHANLYYAKKKWEVEKDGRRKEIERWFVDKMVRDVPEEKIADLLRFIALNVSELDNGEFALRAHTRGLGGGPLTAQVFYGITKGACYTAAATAAVTATAAAAPATEAGAAMGASGVGAGAALVAAGGIAGAGGATVAELGAAYTFAATSAGGFAALAETASLAAGAFGFWLPLP
jgi:hypothetical protein